MSPSPQSSIPLMHAMIFSEQYDPPADVLPRPTYPIPSLHDTMGRMVHLGKTTACTHTPGGAPTRDALPLITLPKTEYHKVRVEFGMGVSAYSTWQYLHHTAPNHGTRLPLEFKPFEDTFGHTQYAMAYSRTPPE